MSKIILIFLSLFLIGLFSTCENNNPVPKVYVNFTIYINPSYLPLNTVGGSVYIPYEGNKGIIVTRSSFEKFSAYDATCTYDPEHEWGKVVIESSGISAKDTVCGSQFSLVLDGMVTNGPAGLSLMQYAVDYNPNMGSLHIHN
ncbi:MAG: hypothetical protein ABFS35_00115 [Bacteroidota bacterium]